MGKEDVLTFDLEKFGFGKVVVPIQNFWPYQHLRLWMGDNSICPDIADFYGVNKAMIGKTVTPDGTDVYKQVVVPQFENEVCGKCPLDKNCNLTQTGKYIYINKGESQKNFEARIRKGKCVNSEVLEVDSKK